jgi:hypothetical protein
MDCSLYEVESEPTENLEIFHTGVVCPAEVKTSYLSCEDP